MHIYIFLGINRISVCVFYYSIFIFESFYYSCINISLFLSLLLINVTGDLRREPCKSLFSKVEVLFKRVNRTYFIVSLLLKIFLLGQNPGINDITQRYNIVVI